MSASGGGGGGVSARGSCDGPGVGSGGTAPARGGCAPPAGGGNCQGGFADAANNEAGGVLGLGCAGGNTALKSMAEVCSGTGCGARNVASGPRPEADTGTAEVGTPRAGAARLDVGPTIIFGHAAPASAEGAGCGAEVGALSGSSENCGAGAVCVAGATGLGAVGPHIDGDAETNGATAGCVAVHGSATLAIVGASMPTGSQGAGAEAPEPVPAGPTVVGSEATAGGEGAGAIGVGAGAAGLGIGAGAGATRGWVTWTSITGSACATAGGGRSHIALPIGTSFALCS